jgi:uncharacterized protein
VRAVLDPNILISALLSPRGAPAEMLVRWLAGEFELIVSELLLEELERALSYPKLRRRIAPGDAAAFVTLLRESAVLAADPEIAPRRSPDRGDDYLLSLAEAERAVVVSGDAHLLGLPDRFPIFSARGFVDALERL